MRNLPDREREFRRMLVTACTISLALWCVAAVFLCAVLRACGIA